MICKNINFRLSIIDVLKTVLDSKLIPIPQQIEDYMNTTTAEKQNKIMYISQAENFSKIPGMTADSARTIKRGQKDSTSTTVKTTAERLPFSRTLR